MCLFGGVCYIENIFELYGGLLRTCKTDRVVSMLLSAESNACTFILSSSFAISTVNLGFILVLTVSI